MSCVKRPIITHAFIIVLIHKSILLKRINVIHTYIDSIKGRLSDYMSGLLNAVTKEETGCLRMTKDTISCNVVMLKL